MTFKTLIITSFLSVSLNCFAQRFTFTGDIAGAPDGRIFLNYNNSQGIHQRDISTLSGGHFSFSGLINGQAWVSLTILQSGAMDPSGYESFFLEPGVISVKGAFNDRAHLKFSGSAGQAAYTDLLKQWDKYFESIKALRDRITALNEKYWKIKYANDDDSRLKSMKNTLDSMNRIIVIGEEASTRRYMDKHNDNVVTAYYLNFNKLNWPVNEVKKRYSRFPASMQQNIYVKEIKDFVNAYENSLAGHPAKNFISVDLNGKILEMNSFKGKYVVLDFWESWCVPCRAGSPHLMDLYNKYHQKGLEVIAIANNDGGWDEWSDESIDEWKKAISKDQVGVWNHILRGYDPRKSENPDDLYAKYAVCSNSLPVKFLLDKNGLIIGRYDSTNVKELDKKLTKLFDKGH